jgi:hypothetical protein
MSRLWRSQETAVPKGRSEGFWAVSRRTADRRARRVAVLFIGLLGEGSGFRFKNLARLE